MSKTFYLGTQGWSYKDWIGSFYPSGTRNEDFLSTYATIFDAVELDTTFYGTPTASRIDKWSSATPDEFRFTAKLPRAITHDRRLVDADEELEGFVDVMVRLGDKLGPLLIQLPPDFTTDERPPLERFLSLLPEGVGFAAEFRHRSWLNDETYELLRAHGVAWTMIDWRYLPIVPELTTDFSYVRWLGRREDIERVHATQIDRRERLDSWAETLDSVARRVERVYGFVNNHYSGHSPADVRYLRRSLGLPETVPIEGERHEQGTLL
jgi:uncharacterized protein YecE (DUF72 family)